MARLTGRTVLVTGAASGIGAASSRRLAADGAQLLLADIDGPGVEKLAAELGQAAIRADVTRGEEVDRMIAEAYTRWGRLAVFFVLQAVARRMLDQGVMQESELRGKLIQTASIASYRGGNHLMTPYSASKAGVVSLTRSAAQVLAPPRITRTACALGQSRRQCGSRSTASGALSMAWGRARRGSAASVAFPSAAPSARR